MELTQLRPGELGVRDSKDGTTGPVLKFTTAEFVTFATQVREGRLNLH